MEILIAFLFYDLRAPLRRRPSYQAKKRQPQRLKLGLTMPIKLKLGNQSPNKRNSKGLQIPSRLSTEVHLLRIPSIVCFMKIKREDHRTLFPQLD